MIFKEIIAIWLWLIVNFKLTLQQSSEFFLEFYPCPDSKNILETFSNTNPPSYNVTILTSQIDRFVIPKRLALKIKFDRRATIVPHNRWLYFFDDQTSFEGSNIFEKPTAIVLTVSPVQGRKLPNVINATINSMSVCNSEMYKDVWDKYVDLPEETTTVANTNATTTASIPKANSTCGRRTVSNEGFITNGFSSKPGNWPWHAALYRFIVGGSQSYICGATLISKTRVLTAGHCVVEYGSVLLPERLVVVFGKYNFNGDNIHLQEKKVYEIVLHADFSHSTLNNDIALLKMSSEVKLTDFVKPICLPEETIDDVRTGYVVGWGATENAEHSDILMETELPIVSDLACIKSHPIFFIKLQMDGMLCAGFKNGTNVCNGDSGSGMFVKKVVDDIEIWYLHGIVSLGIPTRNGKKCDPTQYSLFSSVRYYMDFVQPNL